MPSTKQTSATQISSLEMSLALKGTPESDDVHFRITHTFSMPAEAYLAGRPVWEAGEQGSASARRPALRIPRRRRSFLTAPGFAALGYLAEERETRLPIAFTSPLLSGSVTRVSAYCPRCPIRGAFASDCDRAELPLGHGPRPAAEGREFQLAPCGNGRSRHRIEPCRSQRQQYP